MDEKKKVKSFRLTPRGIELLEKAAAASGLSEGDLVERCVEAQLGRVLAAVSAEREKARRALEAVLPRARAKRAPAGLTKIQQQ